MSRIVVTIDLFTALLDSRRGGTIAIADIARDRGWVGKSPRKIFDHWDWQNKRLHAEHTNASSWRTFRDLAADAMECTYGEFDLSGEPQDDSDKVLASVPLWPPWPDSVAALQKLNRVATVGILSNVDDDIFATTAVAQHVDPEQVHTSARWRAYKPQPEIYIRTREEIRSHGGTHLHIASSPRDVQGASAAGAALILLRRPGITAPHSDNSSIGVIWSLTEAADLVHDWDRAQVDMTRGNF